MERISIQTVHYRGMCVCINIKDVFIDEYTEDMDSKLYTNCCFFILSFFFFVYSSLSLFFHSFIFIVSIGSVCVV
jgi:hypothetical protein